MREVNLMGQIYANAHTVLVWLGEDSNNIAKKAFGFLMEYNKHVEKELQNAHQLETGEILMRMPSLNGNHCLRKNLGGWIACKELLSMPWFRRVWVLQEVGLAQRARAYLGVSEISFADVVLFCVLVSTWRKRDVPDDIGLAVGMIGDAFISIWPGYAINRPRTWMKDDNKLLRMLTGLSEAVAPKSWDEILHAGRNFQSTEKVDHIYAFLGHPTC